MSDAAIAKMRDAGYREDWIEAMHGPLTSTDPEGVSMEAKERLIRLAVGLVSQHGENPEYDRACTELVCDFVGISMDYKDDILRALMKGDPSYAVGYIAALVQTLAT